MFQGKPVSVLLLEDEAFISFDLADHFQKNGFTIAGVLASSSEALVWLKTNTADVVILDIELRDGSCVAVARMLDSLNIPFVVHSSNLRGALTNDPAFMSGCWLSKPCLPDELVAAVAISLPPSTRPERVSMN